MGVIFARYNVIPGGQVKPYFLPSSGFLSNRVADGANQKEKRGKLIVDATLRAMFDYSLSTLAKYDPNIIHTTMRAERVRRLPGSFSEEAYELFGRYVHFKRELANLLKPAMTNTYQYPTTRYYLETMRALRARFFSEHEIQGLFGQEDRDYDYIVKRLHIIDNDTLGMMEKYQQLLALDASLPADTQVTRRESIKHLTLADAESALRQQGGDDNAVYRLRAQLAGQHAAERLAQVDQEIVQWKRRIENYRVQREAILARQDETSDDKRIALRTLGTSLFNQWERRRLPAYFASEDLGL